MMWLLFLGCSGENTDTGKMFDPLDLGGPQSPELSLDVLEESVLAAFQSGLPTSIQLRNIYASFLQNRQGGCPAMENQSSGTWQGVWFDDCSTTGGYHFWGTAIFFEFDEENSWAFNGVASFQLQDPQGYTFLGGGEFESELITEEGVTSWFSRIGGTFLYPPYEGFYAQRGEASLFLEAQITEDSFSGQIDGGVAFTDVTFYFNSVTFDNGICDGLPQGELKVRDSSDFWFSVNMEDCSGCGEVTWRAQPQGELCFGNEIKESLQTMKSEVLAH